MSDVECLRDIATFERALVVNASSHIAFVMLCTTVSR